MAKSKQRDVPLKLIGEAARPTSSRVIPPDPVRTCVLEACVMELDKCSTENLIAWLPIFGRYALREDDDG